MRPTRQHAVGAIAGGAVAMAVCLLVGASVFEKQSKDMRWLSRRLVEKRAVLEQQSGQLAEMVASVEQLATTLADAGDRLRAARTQSGIGGHSGDEPLLQPVATSDEYADGLRSDVERALGQLVWMDRQAEAVGESATMLTSLIDARNQVPMHRGGVPTVWPVSGRVSSPFGIRTSPGGRGSRVHPGMDIAAPRGARVEAAAAGRVRYAGGSRGYGRMVVVDHGGDLKTVYAHLSTIFASEGQWVKRGDLLGTVGTTGNTTGPHLHYEVRFRGEAIDPMCYLGARSPLGRLARAGARG
jgi:murein DD-endopeptidase MepM/ murein hydrolase activator NlpD